MRKLLSALICLCLVATCMVPVAMASEEVNLTMWTFLDVNADNGRSRVLKELISRFEAANPGVHIEVQTQE
ncbi:MAG: hypothetical protein Q4D04_13570 [Clostridia bacterium]|nr:hypothetical protein [Clostridia bacterium]